MGNCDYRIGLGSEGIDRFAFRRGFHLRASGCPGNFSVQRDKSKHWRKAEGYSLRSRSEYQTDDVVLVVWKKASGRAAGSDQGRGRF
jgi:hypothetical protein